MNKTKPKRTHRHREQTNGCQWGEGWWREQDRGGGLRRTKYQVYIKKIQGHNIQQREYSQYLIITLNGI